MPRPVDVAALVEGVRAGRRADVSRAITLVESSRPDHRGAARELLTGIADVDNFWFPDNVWPAEVPPLQGATTAYLEQMRELAETLLTIAEAALSQPPGFLTEKTAHSTFTMNINWYPPATIAGTPEDNQFRIGPHTDFGTFTIPQAKAHMAAAGIPVRTT